MIDFVRWVLLPGSKARCFAAGSKTLSGKSLLLVPFFLGWASTVQADIPLSERAVLVNLYASTNGASWKQGSGWASGVGTECSWFGVTCDGAQSHVVAISLSFNNLVGTLPSSLSGLTALREFYVDLNKLTGPVPVAPTSLVAGGSNLCDNSLVSSGTPAIDAAWVAAQNAVFVAGGRWLACQIAPPTCTLTASLASIALGGSSTLTASCSPAASTYTWTGGTCAGTTGASCSVTPSVTTTYTVAGVNSAGTGTPASATVTVKPPPPVCTLTASPASIVLGGSSTLTASCSPAATSYVWTGGTCAGASCVVTPSVTTTYTLTGSNAGGTGTTVSATVTVILPPTPVCTLTASPSTIVEGGSSTLTARCDPAATTYAWTGGSCAGTSEASCTVTPSATTAYTVTGSNAGGSGNTVRATVAVIPLPAPFCTLTATPASIYAGSTSTLTARCTPVPTFYVWTGGTCVGTSEASCLVTPSATTTYTVAGVNSTGAGPVASATLAVIQPPTQAIPPSERAVLVDLYNSTNGASWIVSTNWNGPVGTECSWYGVTCDGALSHVTNIALPGNNLVGTLPSLSGLAALQFFNVNGNQLSGPIPPLNGLTDLQYFSADGNPFGNQLTGSIPSLSGLTALQYFSVNGNQLSGSIPPLSGLTALQYFGVDSNQLTGSIPPLSGLTGLQGLGVGFNQLTGPVPAAPASLLAGKSNLCDNSLVSSGNQTIDAAWMTAQNASLSVARGNWLACQATGISQNYGSATISFRMPPQFTSYTVTCTAAGQTERIGTGTRSPITVQGLTGDVLYSCAVTASDGITASAPLETVPVKAQSVVPMMMLLLFD